MGPITGYHEHCAKYPIRLRKRIGCKYRVQESVEMLRCGYIFAELTARIWGPVKSTPKMTTTEAINSHISTCIFP
jgi:hypothetical protein